jgi:hypothetical protein
MKFEKPENNSLSNFDKIDKGPEAALLPEEREAKLKEGIKASHQKLKKLLADFSILSEEDYFYSRQKLEEVLDKIRDVETEQQIMKDKLEEILKVKEQFDQNNLQKELDDNLAFKN